MRVRLQHAHMAKSAAGGSCQHISPLPIVYKEPCWATDQMQALPQASPGTTAGKHRQKHKA